MGTAIKFTDIKFWWFKFRFCSSSHFIGLPLRFSGNVIVQYRQNQFVLLIELLTIIAHITIGEARDSWRESNGNVCGFSYAIFLRRNLLLLKALPISISVISISNLFSPHQYCLDETATFKFKQFDSNFDRHTQLLVEC